MNSSQSTLGFLGDGQLAMMLGESAQRHGIPHFAVGQDPSSSYAHVFPAQHSAHPRPEGSVYTLENEFWTADQLIQLENQTGARVIPRPQNFFHFESKIHQRRFFDSLGIPGPAWSTQQPSLDRRPPFEFPWVIKTARGGYDGYGVRFVESPEALASASLPSGEILIEQKVKIKKEFAQGVLLDGRGGRIYTPLVESIQQNGICVLTLSQSTLEPDETIAVQNQARNCLDQLANSGLEGLYHFEFFWTHAGELLINEGAPRPHNSAHLMNRACEWSQFDLLVEYLRQGQLPLPTGTQLNLKPGMMVNLLGKTRGQDYRLALPPLPPWLEIYPQLYFKKECRPGRKMGHLNLIDSRTPSLSAQDFLDLGQMILESYSL